MSSDNTKRQICSENNSLPPFDNVYFNITIGVALCPTKYAFMYFLRAHLRPNTIFLFAISQRQLTTPWCSPPNRSGHTVIFTRILFARVQNARSHTPTEQRVQSRLFDHPRYESRFCTEDAILEEVRPKNMSEIPETDKKFSTGCRKSRVRMRIQRAK